MRPAEAGHRFNSLGACPEVGATDDCSGSRRVSGPRARPTIRVLAGHVDRNGDQIRSHLPRVDVTGYAKPMSLAGHAHPRALHKTGRI